jgi:hypothetical protein
VLEVQVFNQNVLSDTLLGTVLLPLTPCFLNPGLPYQRWHFLWSQVGTVQTYFWNWLHR